MFEPIFNRKIDTRGIDFEVVHDDVERLNLAAFDRTYDITKLSFNAYTKLIDRYQLLHHGCALGENCGPVLIAREPIPIDELPSKKIAIPGIHTTANLMLTLALPSIKNKIDMLFSDIEDAILSGEVDAGLIIHESRFTYEAKRLVKLLDVGEYWESETQTPIPLGGIAIARDLDHQLKQTINSILKESIDYAFRHNDGIEYIRKHAQEMDESVMRKHIALYVNEYSKALGEKGRASIQTLIQKLVDLNRIEQPAFELFV